MADAIFDDPRLARVYDPLDPDRSDLDVYVAMVVELGVRSVLDVGCGTGTFACMLARRGVEVTAVDPAAASLDVARSKPGAEAVRWLHGDATSLPSMSVDAAFMTANVAQVFVTDDGWTATLHGIRRAVRPGGWLVFETHDPARRAWEQWTPELTRTVVDIPGVGQRRVVGGRDRRVRRSGDLSLDDGLPARRPGPRVGLDTSLPQSGRGRSVAGRRRVRARPGARRSRSPGPRTRLRRPAPEDKPAAQADSTLITALDTVMLADPGGLVTRGWLVLRPADMAIETEIVVLSTF